MRFINNSGFALAVDLKILLDGLTYSLISVVLIEQIDVSIYR